jgi:hypothetical protein
MSKKTTHPEAAARCNVRVRIAAEREAAIAYWVARMPQASAARIAGYAGTSEQAVLKWRRANSPMSNDCSDREEA